MNFFKFTVLFAALTVSSAANIRYQDTEIETFEQYRAVFNKHYDSPAAEFRARQNFKRSARWLAENRGRFSHDIGFTSVSDKDPEFLTGMKLDMSKLRQSLKNDEQMSLKDSLQGKDLPESLDYREVLKGKVSPVTEQGNCGSCWAHAAAAAMEFNLAYQNNLSVVLSRQELIDCAVKLGTGNEGCGGAVLLDDGWNYTRQFMLHSDADYPLQKKIKPQFCQANKDDMKNKQKYYVRNYAAVNPNDKASDEEIQQSLARFGPLMIAVSANHELVAYSGGVLVDFLPDPSIYAMNHAVVLVGWGTDEETKVKYWIVRNSWGADWGEAGHFRVQRGINSMGINLTPLFLS